MINLSIPRFKSSCRMDFPNAVGVIRNLQLSQKNVSFELVAYGDEQARALLTDPSRPMQLENSDGIVFRKHFSVEIAKIDELASRVTTEGLVPSELMTACCYEYVKSLANPLE